MLDRAQDRTLLLSLGLFGAPAGQAARDREAKAAERRARAESAEADGDRPD